MTRKSDSLPLIVSHIAPLTEQFDACLCDLWGVVHNGLQALPEAVECLIALRDGGKLVVFLSNAPRPPDSVARQIRRLGVPDAAYDGIITSGGLARAHVETSFRGGSFYHLGPDRDNETIANIPLRKLSTPDGADIVICTGLLDGSEDKIDDHLDLLQSIADAGIPFVCANPDRVVHVGRNEVYCSGELAHRLESLGGKVRWFGKPFANAYQAAEDLLNTINGRPIEKSRILAIGDSMETDIRGAYDAGLQSLLIADGIHHAELAGERPHGAVGDGESAQRGFFDQFDIQPNRIMPALRS